MGRIRDKRDMMEMERPLRVLVVDDSAYNRVTLTKMLESSPDIEVVGTAVNGRDALRAVKKLRPDLITLDIEMPEMDGFTFLRILMNTDPIPVIVVSSKDEDRNVFKALELGAVDFIPKPTDRISKELFDIKETLLDKISTIPYIRIKKIDDTFLTEERRRLLHLPHRMLKRPKRSMIEAIAIGASTGGPPAINWILSQIGKPIDQSIVISQHMPPGFTKAFAERLNKDCHPLVKEAEDGEPVESNKVLISPGGFHMTFRKVKDSIVVKLIKGTKKDKYIPSIDMMFKSAAEIWGKRLVGIVLTGMGRDGAEGAQRLKSKGGRVIAESEETALISSMPQAVVSSGAADEVLPIYKIGEKIIRI